MKYTYKANYSETVLKFLNETSYHDIMLWLEKQRKMKYGLDNNSK